MVRGSRIIILRRAAHLRRDQPQVFADKTNEISGLRQASISRKSLSIETGVTNSADGNEVSGESSDDKKSGQGDPKIE